MMNNEFKITNVCRSTRNRDVFIAYDGQPHFVTYVDDTIIMYCPTPHKTYEVHTFARFDSRDVKQRLDKNNSGTGWNRHNSKACLFDGKSTLITLLDPTVHTTPNDGSRLLRERSRDSRSSRVEEAITILQNHCLAFNLNRPTLENFDL